MLRLLIDNDVLVKAAHWGLLDHLPALVEADWNAVAAPESLIYRARRADPKLFRNAAAAADLFGRLAKTARLPPPNVEVVRQLQGAVGIDVGELALIGALYDYPETILLTGDKRALVALADPAFATIHERIRGRVMCLEQFLAYVLTRTGPEALAVAVGAHRELDAAARCIVGSTDTKNAASIQEGLKSYINDLNQKAAGVLTSDPK